MNLLRTVILLFGIAAGYLLLRGWPAGIPPLVRACGAVLVLVASVGMWSRRGQGSALAARVRRAPGVMDFAAISMLVLAIECGFLWLLSAAPLPLETVALNLEQRLRPQAAAARTEAQGGSQMISGNWLWDDQTRRPLPRRTNFQPGNRPEVFVRLRDRGDAAELLRGQLYVRSFALARYERAAWSALPGRPRELQADAAGFVQLPGRVGRTIVHEVFHSADPRGQNSLTGIHGMVAVQVPQLMEIDDGLHLLPPPVTDAGYEYVAASSPLRLEDIADRADLRVPAAIPAALLELPEAGNFGPRIRELANLAAGSGGLGRRLLNVQNHLRTTLDYSLETTNPRDLDPIENFLFHEQRGHCEYFATAGALLVRALGIPARTAYGWAGGTYYESSNMFVFRAREAHAWTEVWLDGFGWIAMDPTPPAAIGGELARVAAPGEQPPTETDLLTAEMAMAGSFGEAPDKAALFLMACFGLPGLVVLAGRRLFSRRDRGGPRAVSEGVLPTPDYLLAWRRASARRGLAMKSGMTLRRHLSAIGGEEPSFARALLEYHYSTRYEGAAADPRREKQLIAEIRHWGNAAVGQTTIS